ncbi:magnesium transporter CorA family protein [uncultured Clostridium sp.]|jgi:magnesium transporter|uniref:magnesium transporter CorA family protein n=1 Tax=uncultured Clostridium sp. TaxID=59620 RepID=UPI00261AD357|nr:magnesium transporter CorA family protein [uncultured Clostridium sp.]
MIQIFKTQKDISSTLKSLNTLEDGCWINLISPSEEELVLISKKTAVSLNMLKAALDDEEISRIDKEDENMLFVIDIPFTETEENTLTYDTYPLGIIHSKNYLITVCLKNSKILSDFSQKKIRLFSTYKKNRFTLQIIHRIYAYYLIYLRQIERKSSLIEEKLYKSMKNRELTQLHSLKKSLVYFAASLKSTQITLDRIQKSHMLQDDAEDEKMLEDILIENQQAVEMTNIYTRILSGAIMFSSSIISNNFNRVAKILTSLTTVCSLYTVATGIYGMNVVLPLEQSKYAFIIVMGFTSLIALMSLYILDKNNLLR